MRTTPSSRRLLFWAMAWGALLIAVLGTLHWQIPFQLSDSFGIVLQVSDQSLTEVAVDQLASKGFMRPLFWIAVKVIHELSAGNYFFAFKAYHLFQTALLMFLFVAIVAPRTRLELAVLPAGTMILLGSHTLDAAVREIFGINHYLTTLVGCLFVVWLSLGKHSRWKDVAACFAFAWAVFSIEMGVLVWVALVAMWLVGARGVSRAGVVSATVVLGVYFVLRFVLLDVGTPGVDERASGFFFERLEVDELAARFGAAPLPFYVYNVIASLAGLLFAEPRGGVLAGVGSWLAGSLRPWQVIWISSSTFTTLLIARFAWRRRGQWRHGKFDPGSQIVATFAAVLVANAVLSFPYTKDVIMAPAGVLYALAGYHALLDFVRDYSYARRRRAIVAVAATLILLTTAAWTLRVASLAYGMRIHAYTEVQDWVAFDDWLAMQNYRLDTPARRALAERMRADALAMRPPNPAFAPLWLRRWLETY